MLVGGWPQTRRCQEDGLSTTRMKSSMGRLPPSYSPGWTNAAEPYANACRTDGKQLTIEEYGVSAIECSLEPVAYVCWGSMAGVLFVLVACGGLGGT